MRGAGGGCAFMRASCVCPRIVPDSSMSGLRRRAPGPFSQGSNRPWPRRHPCAPAWRALISLCPTPWRPNLSAAWALEDPRPSATPPNLDYRSTTASQTPSSPPSSLAHPAPTTPSSRTTHAKHAVRWADLPTRWEACQSRTYTLILSSSWPPIASTAPLPLRTSAAF